MKNGRPRGQIKKPVSGFYVGCRYRNDWQARWKAGEFGPNERGRKLTLKDK